MGAMKATLVKIISSEFDKAKRLIVKHLGFGKSDVKTSISSAPYGVDANPIKDMIGIYMETEEKGRTVLVGYMNKNSLAAPGEVRFFSTDASGTLKSFVWLKNDGTVHLNGDTDNLVKHSALNTALQAQVNLINVELGKIATGIAAGGGAYTPAPISLNISTAKVNNAKCS